MKDPVLIFKKTTFHQIGWRSDQKWIFNTFNNPLKLNVSSVQWPPTYYEFPRPLETIPRVVLLVAPTFPSFLFIV